MCYYLNNTVRCWNRPWQYGCNRPNALPGGRAFFVYQCRGDILWLLVIKTLKAAYQQGYEEERPMRESKHQPKTGRNGHITIEILLKICTVLDCIVKDIIEIVPNYK